LSEKNGLNTPAPVILIDAMGLLRKCYQLANVAIVAGSYTSKVGGHNILEPSWYGVPVIFGPYTHTQPDLVELMKDYGAGREVKIEDLENNLLNLLNDESLRKNLGDAGLRLAADVHGATDKTFALIRKRLAIKKHAFNVS
jgi:3-deoxy-D-manno-octulosonic-acid transferase